MSITQVKIVVTGPYSSGKTQLINTISEIGTVNTDARVMSGTAEADVKSQTTVAMDFGRITIDNNLVLYLFGTPGQRRFDFMWDVLQEGMLGFIVMVDSSRPETFNEARSILEHFKAYASVPYVVAANYQDMPDAWDLDDLRVALRVENGVPVEPCIALDLDYVKHVILSLLYLVQQELAQ